MKLSRGDKPFIDYAKMDLQDATKQLLFCFSQEELDCRDYYRMEAALDICDEPERQRRLQGLRRVMAHNFGQQTEEPYVMTESDSDRRRSIKVLNGADISHRYNTGMIILSFFTCCPDHVPMFAKDRLIPCSKVTFACWSMGSPTGCTITPTAVSYWSSSYASSF